MCDCPISCFHNKQAYICLYFQCNINAIFVKYYFTCYIFSIRKFFNSYRIIVIMYILFWNFPLCTSSLSPISCTYRYFLFDDFLCDIVNFRSSATFYEKFKIIYCDWWNITTKSTLLHGYCWKIQVLLIVLMVLK